MPAESSLKQEIPEGFRDFVKLSIEQAHRAFEMLAAISEGAGKGIVRNSRTARSGMVALQEK